MVALKGQRPDENTLARMVRVLDHRGPDDSGYMIDGPCGLGNTRLAVIDPSPAGHQPMQVRHTPTNVPSRSGEPVPPSEAWIVYNGEVYNFNEVRAVLSAMRHHFTSHTDTETLLRSYIQFGASNFIKPYRGMFALAIWDVTNQRLLLVRDRLGEKPLYYTFTDEWMVFGSEIKAILEHPDVPRRFNADVLPHYLTYGYPPSPDTLFRGIHTLPPGHMLSLDLSRSQPIAEIIPYWQPPYPVSGEDPRTEENIATDLLAHLRWSVRLRLLSDVPLGAFLSGGLDSAAIVALMAQESTSTIKTFSIGFRNEPSFDETRYARKVQAKFVTEHHEFIVSPDVVELVDDLIWHHDQPFGDSSAIPTYLISKLARQHVTVALTGDGGDELFAGYERFRAARLASTYSHLPGVAQRAVTAALSRFSENTDYAGLVRNANRFVRAANLPLDEQYLSWIRYVASTWVVGLLGESQELAVREHYRQVFGSRPVGSEDDIVSRLLDVNIRSYLPEDLLVKVDRMSMAASLEARAPFLDHQLVQYAAAIPTSMKLRRGVKKYILKRALRGLLPDSIIDRKKHGFGVPVGAWFRTSLAKYARSVLLNPQAQARGVLNSEVVETMLETHIAGKADLGHSLWTLLTLELWLQRYFA
ncbi:MAG: asparagine synthase (glutamine-hydrolyzing) [Anaerolineae bacterium]|nr:asparagine synthase (glutamine-hydrolyzing) [Anaerolineae bacterium]